MLSRRPRLLIGRSPIVTRSVLRHRKTNQGKTKKMADTQTITHQVYTATITMPKFSGESDSIKLEDYISRVQTYITNKGITSSQDKIEAFKANIDLEKGKARVLINCRPFTKDITDYDEYLEEFRKHFTTPGKCEPLKGLVKYLNLKRKSNESDVDFLGRLDTYGNELEGMLKGSQWAMSGSPNGITFDVM